VTTQPRKLRSNLEPGTSLWAGRRALWRALGISEEDLQKPKIAVVNSSSELAICFSHLDGVAAAVKEAIRAAGGLPFEVRTAAPSDFVTSVGQRGLYILPSRDLVAADIEVQVEGALLDGMICLASCDKTAPGQLMAAGRLNIPTIVVACGYQQSGIYKGEHIDVEEVFLKAAYIASGRITVEELTAMTEVAICSPGVCAGMGTANSMHIVTEALGMALPGSTPIRANSPRMLDYVQQAGKRIVEMVWEDLKPRDIITEGAIRNAAAVTLALSGSINCIKHLAAIAYEAELDTNVYDVFSELSDKIPLLMAIRPSGDSLIEDLEDAGGARAVMKRLERFLDLDAKTVNGQTVGQLIKDVSIPDDSPLRTVEDPLSNRPTIIIVRGSLLPGGGIVRLGGVGERMTRFRGPAAIYHSREEAVTAINSGEVKPGQVMVLRGIGVRGGPGMAFTSAVVFALDGSGLIDRVALITEGQVSGLVNRGLVVGEASPEAAEGGPLAYIDNGDMISIDVDTKSVDLEVPEEEMARRRAEPREFGAKGVKGVLGIYQQTARPVHLGANMS
jgi:dihydroxy-acid dehydratase